MGLQKQEFNPAKNCGTKIFVAKQLPNNSFHCQTVAEYHHPPQMDTHPCPLHLSSLWFSPHQWNRWLDSSYMGWNVHMFVVSFSSAHRSSPYFGEMSRHLPMDWVIHRWWRRRLTCVNPIFGLFRDGFVVEPWFSFTIALLPRSGVSR